jgi:hypothetical protein
VELRGRTIEFGRIVKVTSLPMPDDVHFPDSRRADLLRKAKGSAFL